MIPPEKLDPANEPKRLLSIVAGGLRGTLGAEILVRLEELLEKRTGVAGLANHFELIGGTSTGAFLAAGLALGIPARTTPALRDVILRPGPALRDRGRRISMHAIRGLHSVPHLIPA